MLAGEGDKLLLVEYNRLSENIPKTYVLSKYKCGGRPALCIAGVLAESAKLLMGRPAGQKRAAAGQ